MQRWSDLEDLRGVSVLDGSGQVVGEVEQVFADQLTERGEWVLVRAGGRGSRFVPLVEATYDASQLHVPYDEARIAAAPDVGSSGHLNVDDEAMLYVHYGLDPWEHGAVSGGRTGGTPTGVPLPPHPPDPPDSAEGPSR